MDSETGRAGEVLPQIRFQRWAGMRLERWVPGVRRGCVRWCLAALLVMTQGTGMMAMMVDDDGDDEDETMTATMRIMTVIAASL